VTQQPGNELADVYPSADISTSPAAAQDQGESAQTQAVAGNCEEPTTMALLTIVLTRDRHTPHRYAS
jgi:hypothetical protein